jgi:hypothetical protein
MVTPVLSREAAVHVPNGVALNDRRIAFEERGQFAHRLIQEVTGSDAVFRRAIRGGKNASLQRIKSPDLLVDGCRPGAPTAVGFSDRLEVRFGSITAAKEGEGVATDKRCREEKGTQDETK